MKFKISNRIKILLISSFVAVALVLIGFTSRDIGVIGNSIILAVFILATPQYLIRYSEYRGFKEMESKFPLLLRDIIESLRAGMPFHKAIIISSKLDYGRLSDEVKKMANQLSWGVPLDKVLDQFATRIKRSKRLYTAVKIIREAHLSGGNEISTLERIVENSNILEDSNKERRSLLSQYVILMYAISLIFIVIVAAINNLMTPIFTVAAEGGGGEVMGLTNPCDSCGGFGCLVCDLFSLTSKYLFSIKAETMTAYYTALFFYMSLVQSIFSGLVAGQISENSILAGLKHSIILSGITFGAFTILIKLGFLGM
ncbi:hypothetical protein DRP07_06530 [Archaeoglobales archaeon]|nr:MAG: hypothetical protein DRP07_06530 [Archaeoglobales archaeon]